MWCTRNVTPGFNALWELSAPLLSQERRRLFLEVIEHGGGQRGAPAQLRLGAGRP